MTPDKSDPIALLVTQTYSELTGQYGAISAQRIFIDNTLGALVRLLSYVPPKPAEFSPLDFGHLNRGDGHVQPEAHAVSIGLLAKALLSEAFVSNDLFDKDTSDRIRDVATKGLGSLAQSSISVFASKAKDALSLLESASDRTTGVILRSQTPSGVRIRNPDPTERALPAFTATIPRKAK
ncbi:hypothetical protein HY990_02830 [Candidatus Micrarchaeota archaeon]|nr:hypothetical protein [Candidatus Micrarchaeota archaeon]